MSVKKVRQFRCIPKAKLLISSVFNTCISSFCFSFAFCLTGTCDVRRLRFARGSLGEVFTLGTRGISRVRREFLVLTEVRSREKKTLRFSRFSDFTETGNRARNLKVPVSLLALVFRPRPPSFIQYGGHHGQAGTRSFAFKTGLLS